MKKVLKRIAALFLVALVGVSSVACSLDGLEQPEWLEQALCDHVFDEEEILKEPTCGEKGKKEEICSDCGKTRITTIRATGEHIYNDEELTSPTPWNERVTASGANVLDGSIAQIKKVVGASVKSKNLLPYPYAETTKTQNGITFTDNGDGTITIDGEATAEAGFALKLLQDSDVDLGSCFFTGAPSNVNADMCYMVNTYSGFKSDTGKPFNVLAKYCAYRIVVKQGAKLDNAVFKPMVNQGETALPYEPYFEGLKPATFAGIKSTGANGEESVFEFPKTEVPSGAEIDFDRQVIVGVDGTETPFTERMKMAGRQYTVWNGGTETVLGNDGAEYGAITTITIDYVFVCTVCGGRSGDIPLEELPKCSHQEIDDVGECLVCGINVFDAATTSVNVGDSLAGWYRVPMDPMVHFDVGFRGFDIEGYSVENMNDGYIDLYYSTGAMGMMYYFNSVVLNDNLSIYQYNVYYMDSITRDNWVYFYIPEKIDENLQIHNDAITVEQNVPGIVSGLYLKSGTTMEKVNL